MVRKKNSKTFVLPIELRKPVLWTGPVPPFVVQGMIESDEQFVERKASHDAECARAIREAALEFTKRFVFLARKFDTDFASEGWEQSLCIKLAIALCPVAFSVDYGVVKRGRKKIWDAARYTELYVDVESARAEHGYNDTQACKALIQRAIKLGRGRYLPIKGSSLKEATSSLLNRLAEARNPLRNPVIKFVEPTSWNNDGILAEIRKHLFELYSSPEMVRP